MERGELALSNGYEETGSPSLRLAGTTQHQGKLYSKYPALYALLAAPFLVLFGEAGLFYLNCLALIGAVWLLHRMTRLVFGKGQGSQLSLALLLGGTFFWYYSQAVWPHMLQVFLILAATYLAGRAIHCDEGGSLGAVAAGAAVGLAVGVRLDTFFAIPAIGTLCMVGKRSIRRFVGMLAGMIPPLGLLSYLNLVKFGRFTPFSYGPSFGTPSQLVSSSYPAVLVPILLLCTVFLAREGVFSRLVHEPWRRRVVYGLVGLTAASLAHLGEPLLRGIGILLVDMRVLEPTIRETGMIRTASNAVVYAGHLKKALFQSAPFLPLVLLPLLKSREDAVVCDRTMFRWLYLIPASYVIVFCGLRWHGGMAFDMRYLIPTLPFFAVLAAGTLGPLLEEIDPVRLVRSAWFRLSIVLLLLLFAAAVLQREIPSAEKEFLFLTLPLILSVGAFVLVARHWWKETRLSYRWVSLLCIPLFWGGPVAMADYAQQNAWRSVSEEVASRFAPHIPDHSLVLGLQKDLLSRTDDVWFASLSEESLPHVPDLVASTLERGRTVYLLQGREEHRLEAVGLRSDEYRLELLEPYRVVEGATGGGLFQLIPVGGEAPG